MILYTQFSKSTAKQRTRQMITNQKFYFFDCSAIHYAFLVQNSMSGMLFVIRQPRDKLAQLSTRILASFICAQLQQKFKQTNQVFISQAMMACGKDLPMKTFLFIDITTKSKPISIEPPE